MSELTSESVPPIGADDHVTGEGTEAIVYADFGCPYCAASWVRLRELPVRLERPDLREVRREAPVQRAASR